MQNIIIDKPYRFVPPCRGEFWPRLLYLHLPRYLKKNFGLMRVDCAGVERLKSSLAAGHGILLAPNHSRPCDPQVLGMLAREAHCTLFFAGTAANDLA